MFLMEGSSAPRNFVCSPDCPRQIRTRLMEEDGTDWVELNQQVQVPEPEQEKQLLLGLFPVLIVSSSDTGRLFGFPTVLFTMLRQAQY